MSRQSEIQAAMMEIANALEHIKPAKGNYTINDLAEMCNDLTEPQMVALTMTMRLMQTGMKL